MSVIIVINKQMVRLFFKLIKVGMSEEMQAFFFHQITSQEESRCKSFLSGWVGIVTRCVTWVGKL